MELLEANQIYKIYTKNDRSVGTVIYRKAEESEDMVFRPYFHKEGDPWIGYLEKDKCKGWRNDRELFGRYLDDPHFKIGNPTIKSIIHLDITTPEWMGESVVALVDFDNDGTMDCRYASDRIGPFLGTVYEYEGELDMESAMRFATEKIKEDQSRIELLINSLPKPPGFGSSNPFDDDE